MSTCPICQGAGKTAGGLDCNVCEGTGQYDGVVDGEPDPVNPNPTPNVPNQKHENIGSSRPPPPPIGAEPDADTKQIALKKYVLVDNIGGLLASEDDRETINSFAARLRTQGAIYQRVAKVEPPAVATIIDEV